MLVVPGVEHHLHVPGKDFVLECPQELGHKLTLRAGAAHRDQEPQRLALSPSRYAGRAVSVYVVHHVLGAPVPREANVGLG